MVLQGRLGKYHMSRIPASTLEDGPKPERGCRAINLVTDGKSRILLFVACRALAIPARDSGPSEHLNYNPGRNDTVRQPILEGRCKVVCKIFPFTG